MTEKRELSILIPVYNTSCTHLVQELQRQAEQIPIAYEIIVADDASPIMTYSKENETINKLPNCRYIKKEKNEGSAANRNFLAKQSHYPWLLFLDCDIVLPDKQFIYRYISDTHTGVINGGIYVKEDKSLVSNLRYIYEKDAELLHSVEKRQAMRYKEFRSTNFLIAREDIMHCPFDERFKLSGYEDVLFGKHLKQAGIDIHHIQNPVLITEFENNIDYIAKTERNLRTLYQFRKELKGYSHLLTFIDGIHIPLILNLIRYWHKLFGRWEKKNLCGFHPNLLVFKLYRLGYYTSLK